MTNNIDLQIKIESEGSHECIQENRGDEIWMYCPICEVYVRKFDSEIKPIKLVDTGFTHTGNILFGNQANMN